MRKAQKSNSTGNKETTAEGFLTKIVGDNWWLERDEYDGAEGWEFKVMPIKPNSKPVYNYSPFYDDED